MAELSRAEFVCRITVSVSFGLIFLLNKTQIFRFLKRLISKFVTEEIEINE